MSLFDNVRKKPITSELKLVVAIKYGQPEDTPEYLDRLPDAVVTAVYKKLNFRFPKGADMNLKRELLGIHIGSDVGSKIGTDIVNETLYEYHLLLS
jgi:hypothetical protein